MQATIYLITNPKGYLYVGKTNDIKRRLEAYKYLECKSQKRLYNSLKKYGFENHKVKILHTCLYEESAKWEKFYIEAYNSFSGSNKLGMNLTTGGEGYILSEESKKIISDRMTGSGNHQYGKKQSQETIDKRILRGENHYGYGKKRSPETCEKIRKTNLEKGIVPATMGKPLSLETREKLRQANLGKKWPEAQRQNFINKISVPIICSNGIKYKSAAEAGRELQIDNSSITKVCKGKKKAIRGLFFQYA